MQTYVYINYRGYGIQTGRSDRNARAGRAYVYQGATAQIVAVIDVCGADAVAVACQWLDMVLGPDIAAIEAAAKVQAEAERRIAADAKYLARVRAAAAAVRQREIEREIAERMQANASQATRQLRRSADNRPVSSPDRIARLRGYAQ